MIKNIIACIVLGVSCLTFAGFQETTQDKSFSKKLSLRVVQNKTTNSSFKLFYANNESLALVAPTSEFLLRPGELFLQQGEIFCIKCVKGGSFLPIYIKDEGKASGIAPDGFYGPFYMSMWLNYPDISDDQKHFVCYVVEVGKTAEFGIRINTQGECQIIALAHMQLMP